MPPDASSSIPARIGPYEVSEVLGRGGMGVVYLARDTRLNRDVAIKMLSPESVEPEQRARFQREALLLASLNHPNIATIHGLEEVDGVRYLILERLQGETLAERLSRGPLPVEEAFRVGIQIAMALEAAHDGHVIHRDLKPGNVMLAPRGLVKVLDFGLARSDAAGPAGDSASEFSRTGHVTGTPGYMSPEQLMSQPQGPFSDMFAFGCVLFECLTGMRAFPGKLADTVVAVLTGEPDWSKLPEIPADVRDLLASCLEKKPKDRLGDAVSARIVLERALGRETGPIRRRSEGKRHNLPRRADGFIGREALIDEARGHLDDERLITLTGPGGSGKTRLAVELAERELDAFPDGVRFVDLTPLTESSRVSDAAAAAFGAANANALLEHLAGRKILLVLDNCEHVLDGAARFVSGVVMAAPHLRIVATSRENLGVPGERILPVPPLAVPDPAGRLDPEEVARLDAVRLFVDRARLVVHDFEPDAESAGVIGDICRRLDGLPLAIELAATRVKLLSVEQIRDRLNDRFRLLKDHGTSSSDRHRTLEATIGWSYDHLDEEERRFFRRLAVFSGGWSLDGALALNPASRDEYEILDRLSRLVDKSLVVVDRLKGGEPRYRFLESVHQYALSRLAESGEENEARDRHLAAMLDLAGHADARHDRHEAIWLQRIEPEIANFRSAVDWAGRTPATAPRALEIVVRAWRYWYDLGQAGPGRRIAESAVRANAGSPRDLAMAGALEGLALMSLEQGEIDTARERYEESLEIAEALGERKQLANVLNGLGAVLSDGMGRIAESRPYFERCVDIYRELGDRAGVAKGLNNLGRVVLHAGDTAGARALFEESLAERRAIGSVQGVAKSALNLVILETRLGAFESARRYLDESLDLASQLHMMSLCASLVEAAARLMTAMGDARRACRMFGAASALRERIGVPLLKDEQVESDEMLATLRGKLGGGEVTDLVEEGRRLSFEDAAGEIRAWCAP